MNVIDSSAWLEYFSDGPNAVLFEPVIVAVHESIVPTICIFEVRKRLIQLHGDGLAGVAEGTMLLGTPAPLTVDIALRAADLALQYKLPAADSIIYATAQVTESILWTMDAHFDGLPGVKYFKK